MAGYARNSSDLSRIYENACVSNLPRVDGVFGQLTLIHWRRNLQLTTLTLFLMILTLVTLFSDLVPNSDIDFSDLDLRPSNLTFVTLTSNLRFGQYTEICFGQYTDNTILMFDLDL